MAREFPNVLFPYNGQYFDFERFVGQIDKLIAEAKVYENDTAQPVSKQVKKQILQALAERLKSE